MSDYTDFYFCLHCRESQERHRLYLPQSRPSGGASRQLLSPDVRRLYRTRCTGRYFVYRYQEMTFPSARCAESKSARRFYARRNIVLSRNDAMMRKKREPKFSADWNTLEPEAQIVRAIVEGREAQHLTQDQLALVTGIHQASISKLERGDGNPSLRTLKRLAAGMGMKLKLEFIPMSDASRE